LSVAQTVYRSRKSPSYDAAAYHAQQSAEKYLKARLQEAGLPVPHTHSLPHLVDLLRPVEPLWAILRPALAQLTRWAIEVRYPGCTLEKAGAKEAIQLAREVRSRVRAALGLRA
jgi:HEPN domain-containing protein